MGQYGHFIAGEIREGRDRQVLTVLNPASEAVLERFAAASHADVQHAIDAAHGAFRDWSQTSGLDRGGLLRAAAGGIPSL